ncbi:MAG: hypothetical protein ACUVTM_04165 [Candidatus Bathyarchaeia archaeon]
MHAMHKRLSGRILEFNTPGEFFNNPKHEATKRFINGEFKF